jgi:hypothetical protein
MSEADYYGAETDKYTEHLLDSILVCSVLENGAVDKEVVITRGR